MALDLSYADTRVVPPPSPPFSGGLRLAREGGAVSLVLPGDFDAALLRYFDELVDWLLQLGPLHLTAEVADEPGGSDGFAFRRLNALAMIRRRVIDGGGSLQVNAAPRLRRTLVAMKLAEPETALAPTEGFR